MAAGTAFVTGLGSFILAQNATVVNPSDTIEVNPVQPARNTTRKDVIDSVLSSGTTNTGGIVVTNAAIVPVRLSGGLQNTKAAVPSGMVKTQALLASNKGDPAAAATVQATTTDPVPADFTLKGDVKVYGKLHAQLYIKHSSQLGVQEIAVIKKGPVILSDFVTGMQGKMVDGLQFQNVEFVYNEKATPEDDAGTWLHAEVLLSGPLGAASAAIKSVLRQDKTLLRVKAFLTKEHNWAHPIQTKTLLISGALPGINVDLGDLITFTEAGLSIQLQKGQPVPPNDIATALTFKLFGKLNLKSPHGQTAQGADFTISDSSGKLKLEVAKVGDSQKFFGLAGLDLTELGFSTELDVKRPISSLTLDVRATLKLSTLSLSLKGIFSKSDWEIEAQLPDFTFDNVRTTYADLFKQQLHVYKQSLAASDLTFTASPKGIAIVGVVNVEGHTTAKGTITLSQHGLDISGSVDNVSIHTGIVLQNAELDVFIGKATDTAVDGSGISFRFTVKGNVSIASRTIQAVLLLDVLNGKSAWTAYGTFPGLSTGDITSALKGSPFDVALIDACIIASNVDGGVPSDIVPKKFIIKAGLQISATIGSLSVLDLALGNKNSPTVGLTLQAEYDESGAANLQVIPPSPQKLSLKGGAITSGPVSLALTAIPQPALNILADFFVKTPNQQLKFTGSMRADVASANLFIELKDQWWSDPLGLSPKISLGPNLALQIGIVYSGAPEIGVTAGIKIGQVAGQATLSVSEEPNQELIVVELDNLGINDVIDFLSLLVQQNIPKPENFLTFSKAKYYLSSGVTIATTTYPPGASFECDAVLFGKHAHIHVAADKTTKAITATGQLDPIEVGPLIIGGATAGAPASFDVQVGLSAQEVDINGQVHLMDLDIPISLHAVMFPTLDVTLHSKLQFAGELGFDLDAAVQGGAVRSLLDLKSLSFLAHVLFKQDIVNYVVAQTNMQFLVAQHGVNDGISAAESTLASAKNKFQGAFNAAQNNADTAQGSYQNKLDAAKANIAAEQQKASINRTQQNANIQTANAQLQVATNAAQAGLQSALDEQKRSVDAAQGKVDQAKRDGDAAVNAALQNLNNAKANMARDFGNALSNLQDAKNAVVNRQHEVDLAQQDVNQAQKDFDTTGVNSHPADRIAASFRLTQSKAVLVSKQSTLAQAQQILHAAQAVVSGPGFAAAQAAVDGYQHVLDSARASADSTLRAANDNLAQTQRTQAALVAAAQANLDATKTTGPDATQLKAAQAALDLSDRTEAGVAKGLADALDAVATGPEKAALDAANAALVTAHANTHDVDAANAALDTATHAGDAVLSAAAWLASNGAGNVLDVSLFEATAQLADLAVKGSAGLKVHLVGTFAGRNVDVSFDFKPNQGADLVKNMFQKFIADIKAHL